MYHCVCGTLSRIYGGLRNPVAEAKASAEDTIEVFDKDVASDEGGAVVPVVAFDNDIFAYEDTASVEGGAVVVVAVFDNDIFAYEGAASVEGGAVVVVAVPDAYKVAVQGNAVGICVVFVIGVDVAAVIDTAVVLVIILFSYMY